MQGSLDCWLFCNWSIVTATASGFDKNIMNFTLADTTVSKASDGSLIEGESIDQVLTVGERIQYDTPVVNTFTASVFSITLYQSGSGTEKTITTGIDNTDKSLVWIKGTTLGYHHKLMDSERGSSYPALSSDTPYPETGDAGIKELTSNGFVLHGNGYDKTNDNKNNGYVAWNFRAAPGFFDVVTWTGDASGAGSRTLSHSLNGTVGTVIVKCTSDSSDWMVWHKSLSGGYLNLNETRITQDPSTTYVSATNSDFTITYDGSYFNYWNGSGHTYVAYLFADDTPGLIKCGSYSSSGEVVNLGFRPQYVMIKSVDNSSGFTGDWRIFDTTRGIVNGDGDVNLWFNEPRAHMTGSFESAIDLNENGFTVEGQGAYGTSTIYIAIAENATGDIPFTVTPEATVSASSGNLITLSDISGPWSTGMKVRGIDLDLKDYPDAILAQDISLTSSSPTAEHTVNNWGDAVWQVATDAAFTQNVQTTSTALSASGTQSGPTFSYNSNTGYYVRAKYTALGQESAWSDTNYFVTQLAIDIEKPIILTPGDDAGLPDFDYTAESSAITNVTSVQGGGSVSVNSNGWKSVTYGGGKFVAVAFSGSNQYMYSSDGINWTAAPTANDAQSWNTITYGNGKFVSLSVYGSGNRLMYSDTPWYGWSSASIPSSGWTSVTYGDGKFVAVAQDGSTRIAYSTNGSSWNYVNNPVGAAQWKSITYGNGMFVAVSGYGGGNRAIYSTNGTSWYATASSNDNNSWNSVVYGNGKFVAVARGGDSNLVMYSTDGINWTGAQPSSNASWTSVIYADGKFVAVAEGGTNRAMYSTDGINWSSASGVENNEWQSITYGDGKFVAVAQNGNSNRVMYSYTGTHWGPERNNTHSYRHHSIKSI